MIVPAAPENIDQAAALICSGEVVAFPTETVYGLGADATDPRAVARVFEVKARPSFDPLIVHTSSVEMVGEVVDSLPDPARQLGRHFWPGPLTVVLPKNPRIPDVVTAGRRTVAVRIPDHPVALDLINRSARPIAAPSANHFGCVSPTTAAHVASQLGPNVPLILDGGSCRIGIESTIVSFLDGTPELLRPGGISLEAIERVVGVVRVGSSGDVRAAPGQLLRHYAPRTPLTLIKAPSEIAPADRIGAALLLPSADSDTGGFAHVEVLSEHQHLPTIAANLFDALHRLDQGHFRQIYAVRVTERGLGRAIMDRLRRGAN